MIAVAKSTLVGAAYNANLTQTKNGKSMLQFSLRIWKPQKDRQDKTFFLPIVAYSGAADILAKYLTDGKLLYLDCMIDVYKDTSNRDRFQFIVEQFSFLGNKEVA